MAFAKQVNTTQQRAKTMAQLTNGTTVQVSVGKAVVHGVITSTTANGSYKVQLLLSGKSVVRKNPTPATPPQQPCSKCSGTVYTHTMHTTGQFAGLCPPCRMHARAANATQPLQANVPVQRTQQPRKVVQPTRSNPAKVTQLQPAHTKPNYVPLPTRTTLVTPTNVVQPVATTYRNRVATALWQWVCNAPSNHVAAVATAICASPLVVAYCIAMYMLYPS